jgi:activator of HSP90 ATPase
VKDFKKYYIINAEPELVYNALTNAATLQLWTGAPAIMTDEPETEFSLWDDSICGKNISFVPGKQIVQEWYFGDQEEASIVTINLHADKTKTSMEVRHINIPDEDFDDIAAGWTELYAASLKDFYTE